MTSTTPKTRCNFLSGILGCSRPARHGLLPNPGVVGGRAPVCRSAAHSETRIRPRYPELLLPFQPRLDIGEDTDPVELALVTPARAGALFASDMAALQQDRPYSDGKHTFYKLAHTSWGIGAVLRTVDSVRCKSAFLSHAYMCLLGTVLTLDGSSRQEVLPPTKSGQSCHVETLPERRTRPGIHDQQAMDLDDQHWADDETSDTYPLDNKIILPSARDRIAGPTKQRSHFSDCITTGQTLALDGCLAAWTRAHGGRRRLFRQREKPWPVLLVLV